MLFVFFNIFVDLTYDRVSNQLAFHAIANHLIDNVTSKVALIDTAGTLSLTRLRNVLILRLHKKSICQGNPHQTNSK